MYSLEKSKYNLSMSAITALAHIYYEKNQEYRNDCLEEALQKIKCELKGRYCKKYNSKKNVVLFYDGMGQDTRGLALTYLKAISKYSDKIVYVTNERVRYKQPILAEFLASCNASIEYLSETTSHMARLNQIMSIIEDYCPSDGFLYTLPYDTSGVLAFMLAEQLTRYQIDFTDHAFWIGVNAFDFCVEFRNYGVTIATQYRNIERKKMILLPFYPRINTIDFKGFDFETTGKKVIFSGGSLYKTFSEDRLFYKIVDHLLSNVNDAIFYYVGSGDKREIYNLMSTHPNRVFYSDEREDFFEVMKKSTIYLNTYPLLGGLMTQYAVAAGKVPITLLHDQDGTGFLINAENTGVFYNDTSSLLKDTIKLLSNKEYLKKRENSLTNCLMTESKFEEEIGSILIKQKGTLEITTMEIDLSRIHEEYLTRFSPKAVVDAIAKMRNKPLLCYFPVLFFKRKFRR